MTRPGTVPLIALILALRPDTGTGQAGLKLWSEGPVALGSPLRLHCAFPAQEHITLVSWWRGGRNRSREDLAVIHPLHGAHILPGARGRLRVTNVSEDGRVALTLRTLDPEQNDTQYCCKFSTFPSGVSERCLALRIPPPDADPSPVPHSLGRAFLRPDVLGALGAGGFFLLGSILLLGHLVRGWARRRRKLADSLPQPDLSGSQETPMALWVQQGLPVRRDPFSAPYVLINLDYFTPQASAEPHGGPLPPPVPPRPDLDRAGPRPGKGPETGFPPLGTRHPAKLEGPSHPGRRPDTLHPSRRGRWRPLPAPPTPEPL